MTVPATTLLVAAAASFLVGASFLAIGGRIRRVAVAEAHRFARNAHTTWWACLGAYLLLQAALTALAAYDALMPGAYLASRLLAIPLLCIAVWGLSTYLAYLYTGSAKAKVVFGALYAAVAAVFAYSTFIETPALVVTDWLVSYQDDSILYQSVYLLVGLPPIVASLAYLSLRSRIADRAQRRRLVLTSIGILAYVASGLAARLAGDDTVAFLTLVPLGLVAAGMVLAAHLPGNRTSLPPVSAPPSVIDDLALAHRLRELV